MSSRLFQRVISRVVISQESNHIKFLRSKAGTGMVVHPKRVENVNRSSAARKQINVNIMPQEDMLEENDELDYLAYSITTHGSKHSALKAEREKTVELLRLSSFVRAKTVENRYFKQPKKPNLLLWACKEQIRLLHQSDPDTWSYERLAEIFPVSETSIKKIVKSRVRLHRLVDIKEHDLFVKRNWENLHTTLLSKHNAINDETWDVLVNIGNEDNILNIFPLEEEVIPRLGSLVPKNLGLFSSIVQDELERKEEQNRILYKKHQEQLDLLKETVLKIREILTNSEVQNKSEANQKPGETLQKSERSYKSKRDPYEVCVWKNSDVSDTSTYLVDGSVYDENGEFLYKVPTA